ncbi:MAG: hypothetical protein HYU67_01240 [Flavobacteriia bacterium]|nr:hypothetical protein [Flavobacteriia bacterium]
MPLIIVKPVIFTICKTNFQLIIYIALYLVIPFNKFISATLGTHLLYDHDVVLQLDKNRDGIIDGVGKRVQFKQVLNIGFSYKF